jgi:hypothetical protein
MFVIISGRQGGKTDTVVRWLIEDPERRIALVASESRKRSLLNRVLLLSPSSITKSFWQDRIRVASELLGGGSGFRGRGPHQIGIDDLEDVLGVLLSFVTGGILELVTMTATPIILPVTAGTEGEEKRGTPLRREGTNLQEKRS